MKKCRTVVGKKFDAILAFDHGNDRDSSANKAISYRLHMLSAILREVKIYYPRTLQAQIMGIMPVDFSIPMPKKFMSHPELAQVFAEKISKYGLKNVLVLAAPPGMKRCAHLVKRYLGRHKAEISLDMYLSDVYPKKF